jgi:hypothetical protein
LSYSGGRLNHGARVGTPAAPPRTALTFDRGGLPWRPPIAERFDKSFQCSSTAGALPWISNHVSESERAMM